ncbi:D-tyrosyl-tRNA(Tyr) deacylase [Petrotoga sp. 9PW.55.5.1]|uniref:D-aminoacyl-tRNA deacylase n=1 Tax=Petrotoga sp. 9PW.55.5.1 TaxID=1308979 RepID=UPI000DC27100|nr:D-aminoacyl-tRNA deacylase [Petrotoga sp. 9PW.55.5.1]RAO98397.1 D-tyrosyl-tRNA(Tyr) deacylase [Petrotoga sp. 9PW.55.5.1]
MRAVVQRVLEAKVVVNEEVHSKINHGLLVFIGISRKDQKTDISWMADKILNLRIFEDNKGKMNKSLLDIDGDILIVSQFTLYGDCRKGRRPSFTESAPSEDANVLYEEFINYIEEKYSIVPKKGVFHAHMKVDLINDGPVTLLLDSYKTF